MIKKSLISIIVPVYEVEEYLSRCVESLVKQTYREIEIILVDDGSPDQCPKLCDFWEKQDERIRVIHKKNGGLSDARNAGISIAQGEYIVFVDSDDWVDNTFVERLYFAAYNTNSDICECEIIKTDGMTRIDEVKEELNDSIQCYETEDALKLLIQDSVFHQYVWNKIYKRGCMEGIFFKKGKVNEDEFWTYQIFGRSKKIAKISNKLYYYFQRNESIMGNAYNLKRLDALEAKKERQEYIERHYPKMAEMAKVNLVFSCLYSGQMAILQMSKEDCDIALDIIINYFQEALKSDGKLSIPIKNKIWIYLAKINFALTCKIRNYLQIGF